MLTLPDNAPSIKETYSIIPHKEFSNPLLDAAVLGLMLGYLAAEVAIFASNRIGKPFNNPNLVRYSIPAISAALNVLLVIANSS